MSTKLKTTLAGLAVGIERLAATVKDEGKRSRLQARVADLRQRVAAMPDKATSKG